MLPYTSADTPLPIAPRDASPPPPVSKDWDYAIKRFLQSLGMLQALRGFEADMLVLNPEWESTRVPGALVQLVEDIEQSTHQQKDHDGTEKPVQRLLDERKLDYVHFAPGVQPRTPTDITRSISHFLAQNRARNDASNRNEFLLSLAEKRRKLHESGKYESTIDIETTSCARADAKMQDRDVQMKYDIAKNEDGPLRKTLKSHDPADKRSFEPGMEAKPDIQTQDVPTAGRYPALDERLHNIETHIAVRYVPSPPHSLLDRVKFLEEHLIQLEREHPPWAALHFNQPRRGWPTPPRPTPIIVPSHLTSLSAHHTSLLYNNPQTHLTTIPATASCRTAQTTQEATPTDGVKPTKTGRQTQSSLYRAVMERLEVQRAMNDLASGSGHGSSSA